MLINNQLMNLLNYSPDTHAKPTRMRVFGGVASRMAHSKPIQTSIAFALISLVVFISGLLEVFFMFIIYCQLMFILYCQYKRYK